MNTPYLTSKQQKALRKQLRLEKQVHERATAIRTCLESVETDIQAFTKIIKTQTMLFAKEPTSKRGEMVMSAVDEYVSTADFMRKQINELVRITNLKMNGFNKLAKVMPRDVVAEAMPETRREYEKAIDEYSATKERLEQGVEATTNVKAMVEDTLGQMVKC